MARAAALLHASAAICTAGCHRSRELLCCPDDQHVHSDLHGKARLVPGVLAANHDDMRGCILAAAHHRHDSLMEGNLGAGSLHGVGLLNANRCPVIWEVSALKHHVHVNTS